MELLKRKSLNLEPPSGGLHMYTVFGNRLSSNPDSKLQLNPTEGMVRRNNHLKIGRYHQHLHELLDMDARDELYKNRSSRKTESQYRKERSLGSRILLKIVSENRFSGKTYFYTIASCSPVEYMMAQFADLKEIDAVRKIIGRYGITGKAQVWQIIPE